MVRQDGSKSHDHLPPFHIHFTTLHSSKSEWSVALVTKTCNPVHFFSLERILCPFWALGGYLTVITKPFKTKINKTWSSVSNSSLVRPRFWSKTNLCFKSFLVQNNLFQFSKFWSKNKYLLPRKIISSRSTKFMHSCKSNKFKQSLTKSNKVYKAL